MNRWIVQPYSIIKLRTIRMLALSVFRSFIKMEATSTPKVDKKFMSDLIQPMAFRATGTDPMNWLGWV
jgi:hypothetical protein